MSEVNYTQHWFYPQILIAPWEEWRDVVGYENLYQVSTWGRVKSLAKTIRQLYRGTSLRKTYKPETLMTPAPDGTGYMIVTFHKEGVQRTRKVHQLVLESFIGPKPKGMAVCHFPDRERSNNNLGNLRWDTYSNNQHDRVFHGTSTHGISRNAGEKSGNAKLTNKNVLEIRSRPKVRGDTKKIAAEFGVCANTIYSIRYGQTWKSPSA